MSIAQILFLQVIIMFVLASIGYIMYRTKKISLEGGKCLSNILIFLSLPCVIIKGFLIERTHDMIINMVYSSIAAILILIICIFVSRIFFKKDAIAGFASAFSNPGFFGVPLITATLGNEAVFFIAAFIAFLNLLQWTYGVSILKGDKSNFRIMTLVKAPFFVAICIGMFFFLSGIKMPEIPGKCIDFLAAVNTPLAMFTIGIYMAQTNVFSMIKRAKLYLISMVRLIIIPVIVLAIFYFLPQNMNSMKLSLLIATACPVGLNVALYAQIYNKDYTYAVETVVVSSVFSIVTMPVLVWVAGLIGIVG